MNQTSGVTPTTQRAERTAVVARWLYDFYEIKEVASYDEPEVAEHYRKAADELLSLLSNGGEATGPAGLRSTTNDGRSVTSGVDASVSAPDRTEQPPFLRDLGELVKQWRREDGAVSGETYHECADDLERVLNSGEHSVQGSSDTPSAEKLAQTFHEVYERLAPEFGYETRKDSAVQWEDVPEKNRRLMTATCGVILSYLFPLAAMTSHSSEGQQP